ncbi:MAG: PilN domain-containing protein [Acidobacteriota bacterium]|nr:PilN domain-containing protein [Acidobacteriota bacterium]
MRISINLATRPFVELGPLLLRLRLALAGLALLAMALGITMLRLDAKAAASQEEMRSLQLRTQQFQQERQRNEARLRLPQNSGVLQRSEFLNDLFARKSFSWTAVMMDLEKVLPAGVQVTALEPVIAKDGSVTIRLRVSGDRDKAVELVRNLENSQRFVQPRLSNESAQAQESGRTGNAPAPANASLVEFDILSGYNPLPARVAPRASHDASAPTSKGGAR